MEDQVYTFKVSLDFCKQNIQRVMEIKGSFSLHQFAETIVKAYNFQLDHAFGFYNNLKNMYDSTEAYTQFCDDGASVNPNEKSVANFHVNTVFRPGKKMKFLFDYGDEWHFLVHCLGISQPKAAIEYPNITKKVGEAPPQYYNSDNDYDEENDNDE
ncbi:hypothetical protein X975_08227, partial [Stegodyphus mimosarum]